MAQRLNVWQIMFGVSLKSKLHNFLKVNLTKCWSSVEKVACLKSYCKCISNYCDCEVIHRTHRGDVTGSNPSDPALKLELLTNRQKRIKRIALRTISGSGSVAGRKFETSGRGFDLAGQQLERGALSGSVETKKSKTLKISSLFVQAWFFSIKSMCSLNIYVRSEWVLVSYDRQTWLVSIAV